MKKENDSKSGMRPQRLETLADGIFAFAMTLLVLSINLPQPEKITDVGGFLLGQLNNFWNFGLSFLLLIFFWLNFSQQFHHVKKVNLGNIILVTFILLFVVLVPFSTSLMSDYPSNMVAELVFNGNMLILFILFTINWFYCYRNGLLETNENREHIKRLSRRMIFAPLIAFIAFLLVFITPGYSTLAYLCFPLLLFIYFIARKFKRV
ncbi:MAG: TMEM175 family protein [Candidatus Pacearchaeota archaeon]|jgi:uncharacterized membrane protein